MLEGDVGAACFLHVACSGYEGADVEPGYGDGQQAYGGEYREASAYVVGDDEGFIAFGIGEFA